ncbi:hypothetical protein [Thermoplasma volcanium GSS1]|uniref:Uncharacterized protein n=1 Tax=Thermoplasma volcanium (strain ATCC 51530 / DSM 4299 / JCM 9571 / NBRC 15438 / GSS1) TaxID=273116 RepID=Q97AU4_THEVO|nr:LysE family translocator [Thermoplasma volcanium]BAB59857.1 hypothetical protein [Thermoplasma volcanium GSS1]
MEILTYLIGVLLGLSLTAPPGPVNSIISVESVRSKIHGSSVGAGAMTADIIFFIIVYSFGNIVPKSALYALYIVGSIVMFYFAYSTLKKSSRYKTRRGNYFVGLLVGISNPFQIIWWVTAGLFVVNHMSLIGVFGLFSGVVLWITIFPFFVNKYAKRYEKYVRIASSVVLISFGVYILIVGIKVIL